MRLKENIAIKSSPDELLFVISTFSSEGLNCVPALIKRKSETNKDQIVVAREPLKIENNAKISAKAAKINEVIAPNLKIALLLKEVVFDLIKSEQAP